MLSEDSTSLNIESIISSTDSKLWKFMQTATTLAREQSKNKDLSKKLWQFFILCVGKVANFQVPYAETLCGAIELDNIIM